MLTLKVCQVDNEPMLLNIHLGNIENQQFHQITFGAWHLSFEWFLHLKI